MALSNKFGWLVLTTGNKSEMSVGYSTLYGDLAGGFAVIKDIFKTLVYCVRGAQPRRRAGATGRAATTPDPGEPIPSIIERAPSAELRPDQRDDQSLPPYETLDRDPARLRGGGPAAARSCSRAACRPAPWIRCVRWSTTPSTSAARRRRGSRSPSARSGATGACRSPTATARHRRRRRRHLRHQRTCRSRSSRDRRADQLHRRARSQPAGGATQHRLRRNAAAQPDPPPATSAGLMPACRGTS
jgi:hypothetical protein